MGVLKGFRGACVEAACAENTACAENAACASYPSYFHLPGTESALSATGISTRSLGALCSYTARLMLVYLARVQVPAVAGRD